MPTRIDIARRLMGGGRAARPGAVRASVQTSSVRYGTAQEACEAGAVCSILLDGSEEPVSLLCESAVSKGERVRVVSQGGSYAVVALTSLVDGVKESKESADSAKDQAAAAKAAAEAAGKSADELAGKVEGVTVDVDGLKSTVTAAAEDSKAALTAASSAQQDVSGFKTEVSQTYQTKADAAAAMDAEVLARDTAIEQSATEIKTSVAENYVNNTTGATYATKTELTQTSESLSATITTASNTAASAKESADSAASASADAKTLATSAARGVSTISAYLLFDTAGLHVGKHEVDGSGVKYDTAQALMSSEGLFEIIDADGTVLATFSASRIEIGKAASDTAEIDLLDGHGRIGIYDGTAGALILSGYAALALYASYGGDVGILVKNDSVKIGDPQTPLTVKPGTSAGGITYAGKSLIGSTGVRSVADGVTVYRNMGLCIATFTNFKPAAPISWSTIDVGTALPTGWRPAGSIRAMLYVGASSVAQAIVGADGQLKVYAEDLAAGTQLSGELTWFPMV